MKFFLLLSVIFNKKCCDYIVEKFNQFIFCYGKVAVMLCGVVWSGPIDLKNATIQNVECPYGFDEVIECRKLNCTVKCVVDVQTALARL